MEIALFVLTAAVVGVQSFVAVGVLFEVARLKAAGVRVPALQVGRAAPAVDDLVPVADSATVLLFVTPTCQRCLDLLSQLGPDDLSSLTVVCHGSDSQCGALRSSDRAVTVYIDDDGRVAELFGVSGTPACVVVQDGLVRAHADVRDEVHLRKLVRSAAVLPRPVDSHEVDGVRQVQAVGAAMKAE